MKITVAKTAGFCMGVRRAVELVLDASNSCQGPIYTLGPLIHNPQVLEILNEKKIYELHDIPEQGRGTVLIRAHGVPPDAKGKLQNAGFNVIDATCPKVIKVQVIIRKHTGKGYAAIILGDRDHPEVIGLLGYAGDNGFVVEDMDGLKRLPSFDQAIVVAQTTQNTRFFNQATEFLGQSHPHYKIFHTICDSTERRQEEVRMLSQKVDMMIVVGGFNSGNTKRLVEVASSVGKPTFHVETESDLKPDALAHVSHLGITAGASTPNWTIKRVFHRLEALAHNREAPWYRWRQATERGLLLTNLYVALGAGSLCYACTHLQGINQNFAYTFISILYVLSMHILNNLTGLREDNYNEPDRAAFYQKYKKKLAFLALLAGGSGLLTASTLGLLPFSTLLLMSIMGLSYNFRIIPARFKKIGYYRICDLPGAKTLLITAAWGVVTTLLPALFSAYHISLKNVFVFIWATGMVFSRSAFFDILDMQGDRIVGMKTIPILLGEKRTLNLLKGILILLIILLGFFSLLNVISYLGMWLMICPVLMLMILTYHKGKSMLPGLRVEFLTESVFVLSGIITYNWVFFTSSS